MRRRRAEDAKGLLLAAIADPNPVIFLEHKCLYRRVRGEVPEGPYETPFEARTVRDGDELVVIAYGAMVHAARAAIEQLEGASVRVLDLRSLVPLDEEAILDAVRECSKVVIVDEANYTCAVGAQVAVADRRARLRATSTGRSSGSRPRTCRSHSPPSSSVRYCRASSASAPPPRLLAY